MPILNLDDDQIFFIKILLFTIFIFLLLSMISYVILDIIRINVTLKEKFTDTKKGSFILSTIPSRLEKNEHVIKALIKNNPKNIYLSIPEYSKREDKPYILPEWLNKYMSGSDAIVKIVRCKDYGPATKFMGIIEQKVDIDPDHYIVIIDDDFEYNNLLLDNFIYEIEKKEKKYGTDNIVLSYDVSGTSKAVMGYAGIIMKRKMLDGIEHFKNTKECFTTDDAYLTAFLREKNATIERPFVFRPFALTLSKTPTSVYDLFFNIRKMNIPGTLKDTNPISPGEFDLNNAMCYNSLIKNRLENKLKTYLKNK